MSGCISSQASEGVCHCAAICTRFSGRLNPLTPQFLIKITLGVISRKSWGWRSEGLREGWVNGGRVWIDGKGGEFDPITNDICCQVVKYVAIVMSDQLVVVFIQSVIFLNEYS